MIYKFIGILIIILSLYLWKWLAFIFFAGAFLSWLIAYKRIKIIEILYALSLQSGMFLVNGYGIVLLYINLLLAQKSQLAQIYFYSIIFDVVLVAVLLIFLLLRPGKWSILLLTIYQGYACLPHLAAITGGSQRIIGQGFFLSLRLLSIFLMIYGLRKLSKIKEEMNI